MTGIIRNLLGRHGQAAVEFYKTAFGSDEEVRFDAGNGTIFKVLTIHGARFFVAEEDPDQGNLSTDCLDGTSVRIHLLVADLDKMQSRAVAAGATEVSPVREEEVDPRWVGSVIPFTIPGDLVCP